MNRVFIQQLDSVYGASKIGSGNVAQNPFFRMLSQTINHRLVLPVIGETITGRQISLDQISSATKRFRNAAVEVAFYEQSLLERLGLPVPPDYYERHTFEMDCLYVLNNSACVVTRKDGRHSIRTSSLHVVKSFPKELIENLAKRHEIYLSVDARPDIERGVLRSLEFRGTDTHRLRLYCVQTQLKGSTIIPCVLTIAYRSKLLQILGHNVVTLRYKQETGNILTLTTSLRMDFLNQYCGKDVGAIRICSLNTCNKMEIILPVIPEGTSVPKIMTMDVLNICSICKVDK